MNKFFQSKVFVFGFLYGISIFLTLNYLSYLLNKVSCADCSYKFGFPFYLHQYGGFSTVDDFLWFGLIADSLFALVFSFVIGFITKFVWSKISSRRTHLK